MKHIQLPDIRKKHQNEKEELIPLPEIPAREIDPAVGLSADEVQARLENGYGNISNSSPTKTVGQIVKSNTLTFFNLVFVDVYKRQGPDRGRKYRCPHGRD